MNMRFKGYDPLMMFYLLSENIVERTELKDFPRDPYEFLNNPKWRERYESDYFQLVMSDVWAWLVWDYLGVRGGMECYSGYDPIWRLAHAYTLWMRMFMKMGVTAEVYFKLEPGDQLAYMPQEELDLFVRAMMDYWNRATNYRKWLGAIKENRCLEDFDRRHSSVKIDMYRKWYHTRAETKVLSFTQAEEEPAYSPSDKMISRLDAERFIEKLDISDRRILKLLLSGYTQKEIAEKTGFATHSGICKRIQKIGSEYEKFIKVEI